MMPPQVPRKRLRDHSPAPSDSPQAKGKGKEKAKTFTAPPRKPTLFDDLDASSTPRSSTRNGSSVYMIEDSQDDASSLTSLSDAEFEDVPPAKRQKAAAESDDEDEDEDIEFEDVEPGQEPVSAVPIHHGSGGSLDLTLIRDTRISLATALGKKGPSKMERKMRVAAHCMHVQSLMLHNSIRNTWLCDPEVQGVLVSHIPPRLWEEVDRWRRNSGLDVAEAPPPAKVTKGKGKSKGKAKETTKGTPQARDWGNAAKRLEKGAIDMSHGDPLFRLVKALAAWWKQRFRVVAPGLRKWGYMPLERLDRLTKAFQQEAHDPARFGERIQDLDEFRRCAQECSGSRDVGAQLFTALLRGLGLEARLVASLQPLGFGWNKLEDADPETDHTQSKQTPQKEVAQLDQEKAAMEAVSSTKAAPRGRPSRRTTAMKSQETSDSELVPDHANSDDEPAIEPQQIPEKRGKTYDADLEFPHYWTEILSPVTNKYLPVDCLVKSVIATSRELVESLEPRGSKADKTRQVMAYVVAFSPDGTAKDVTVRYVKGQVMPGRTKGNRLPLEKIPVYDHNGKIKQHDLVDWFVKVMKNYARGDAKHPLTDADRDEDATDLQPAQAEKKVIKEGDETLQYYKQSKEFALERHLKREEALLPGAKPVKTFTNKGKGQPEPVYARADVVQVKSAETWRKQGRAPKAGEEPLKRVPYRAATTNRRREIAEAERETGAKVLQGLYSEDQTDWIIPPPIEGGVIPKNEYGNIDLFVKRMCPEGAVHLPYRGAGRVCKRLGVDYAEAVVGFEFGNRMAVPVIHGVVVAKEHQDRVIEELAKDDAERARKEDEKKRKVVLGTWRKFMMGLRIVERIKADYGHVREDVDVFGKGGDTEMADAAPPGGFAGPGDGGADDDEVGGGGFLPEGFDEEEEQPAPSTSGFFPVVDEDDDDGEDPFQVDYGDGSAGGGGFVPEQPPATGTASVMSTRPKRKTAAPAGALRSQPYSDDIRTIRPALDVWGAAALDMDAAVFLRLGWIHLEPPHFFSGFLLSLARSPVPSVCTVNQAVQLEPLTSLLPSSSSSSFTFTSTSTTVPRLHHPASTQTTTQTRQLPSNLLLRLDPISIPEVHQDPPPTKPRDMEGAPGEDFPIEDAPPLSPAPHGEEDEARNLLMAHENMRRNNDPAEDDGGPREACCAVLSEYFPDMCPDHIQTLSTSFQYDSNAVIMHVLDQQDSGKPYPTKPRESLFRTMKRKRVEEDEDGYVDESDFDDFDDEPRMSLSDKQLREAQKANEAYEKRDRMQHKDRSFAFQYSQAARTLLKNAFPSLYVMDINGALDANNGLLYPAFLALAKDIRQPPEARKFKSKASKRLGKFINIFEHSEREGEQAAGVELQAARGWLEILDNDARNLERARAEGTVSECGCCFEELAQNRMVHCNGDNLHWFCVDCTRLNAETAIGAGRYELRCMSIEGCESGFSRDQKDRFLNADLEMALDNIEQQAVLRMAGIEGLAECPFCPFAALCPPAEEDKIFECQYPKCLKVSCRLCKHEAHIPKTCEEAAQENSGRVRQRIEEAMSDALIRRCNKCKTPFVKEVGCNKMKCLSPGCDGIQCYVCSKSCAGYEHFDDIKRGGKTNNCPLFDDQEQRHEDEVRTAEEKARKQVREENAHLDDETWEKLAGPAPAEPSKQNHRPKGPDPRVVLQPPARGPLAHGLPAHGLPAHGLPARGPPNPPLLGDSRPIELNNKVVSHKLTTNKLFANSFSPRETLPTLSPTDSLQLQTSQPSWMTLFSASPDRQDYPNPLAYLRGRNFQTMATDSPSWGCTTHMEMATWIFAQRITREWSLRPNVASSNPGWKPKRQPRNLGLPGFADGDAHGPGGLNPHQVIPGQPGHADPQAGRFGNLEIAPNPQPAAAADAASVVYPGYARNEFGNLAYIGQRAPLDADLQPRPRGIGPAAPPGLPLPLMAANLPRPIHITNLEEREEVLRRATAALEAVVEYDRNQAEQAEPGGAPVAEM
ncbi:hypothetical protein QBC39DRAFT_431678 [Podospora conica]|nr:hypothetical protein QBC39DRAFT_431678 [Schizothecium conicum]